MKIVVTVQDREVLNKEREIARAGCSVCPTCGCNRKRAPSICGGVCELPSRRAIFEKNGKRVIGRVDRFECTLCGTVWESDPYEDFYTHMRNLSER